MTPQKHNVTISSQIIGNISGIDEAVYSNIDKRRKASLTVSLRRMFYKSMPGFRDIPSSYGSEYIYYQGMISGKVQASVASRYYTKDRIFRIVPLFCRTRQIGNHPDFITIENALKWFSASVWIRLRL